MKPCDQLTMPPGTKHWFQARAGSAVLHGFSTCVRDGHDRFTDSAVVKEIKSVDDAPPETVAANEAMQAK